MATVDLVQVRTIAHEQRLSERTISDALRHAGITGLRAGKALYYSRSACVESDVFMARVAQARGNRDARLSAQKAPWQTTGDLAEVLSLLRKIAAELGVFPDGQLKEDQ